MNHSLVSSFLRFAADALLILIFGLSALLLSACGGGGDSSGPDTLNVSISANITAPITGQEVRLSPSVTGSTSASFTVTSVTWDFGDSTSTTLTSTATFSVAQYKSYASVGTYTVTLSATDSTGRSGSITKTISVQSFAPTGQLNDTGIDWCSENITTPSVWVNNVVCSAITWGANLWGTAQDAFFGRDAQARAGTLTKVGTGMAGFDFTRLGADGQPLAIQNASYSPTGNEAEGTRWDCVRDNVTDLIWEVKRMDDSTHLRYYTHIYSWYNPDNTTNGGSVGSETGGSCTGVADLTKCNTQAYKTAVQSLPAGQGLCGFRDWRLPSNDELSTLTHLGRFNPAIDNNHFPDVNLADGVSGWTWSSSPYASDTGSAWYVNFYGGFDSHGAKNNGFAVRLVRSGQ